LGSAAVRRALAQIPRLPSSPAVTLSASMRMFVASRNNYSPRLGTRVLMAVPADLVGSFFPERSRPRFFEVEEPFQRRRRSSCTAGGAASLARGSGRSASPARGADRALNRATAASVWVGGGARSREVDVESCRPMCCLLLSPRIAPSAGDGKPSSFG